MAYHSWADRLQHSWAEGSLPRKDAICHAAPARCLDWAHPNRDPAFNPQTRRGKLCSAFCSEEEGIRTSSGLFRNAPLVRNVDRAGVPFMSNVPWRIKLRRKWFHRQSARRVESAFSTMRRRNNCVVFRLVAIQRSAQKMVRPLFRVSPMDNGRKADITGPRH